MEEGTGTRLRMRGQAEPGQGKECAYAQSSPGIPAATSVPYASRYAEAPLAHERTDGRTQDKRVV